MRDLNVDFMDLYKSVDRFIRDAYSSTEGVSEYLRRMEQNHSKGWRCVAAWDADYDKLKRLRRIRNQLSHEVGYDSDICGEADYDWLEAFKARLFSAKDPLAALNKAQEAQRQRRREEQRRIQAQRRAEEARRQQAQNAPAYTPHRQYQPSERKSFWQRLKDFFSGI